MGISYSSYTDKKFIPDQNSKTLNKYYDLINELRRNTELLYKIDTYCENFINFHNYNFLNIFYELWLPTINGQFFMKTQNFTDWLNYFLLLDISNKYNVFKLDVCRKWLYSDIGNKWILGNLKNILFYIPPKLIFDYIFIDKEYNMSNNILDTIIKKVLFKKYELIPNDIAPNNLLIMIYNYLYSYDGKLFLQSYNGKYFLNKYNKDIIIDDTTCINLMHSSLNLNLNKIINPFFLENINLNVEWFSDFKNISVWTEKILNYEQYYNDEYFISHYNDKLISLWINSTTRGNLWVNGEKSYDWFNDNINRLQHLCIFSINFKYWKTMKLTNVTYIQEPYLNVPWLTTINGNNWLMTDEYGQKILLNYILCEFEEENDVILTGKKIYYEWLFRTFIYIFEYKIQYDLTFLLNSKKLCAFLLTRNGEYMANTIIGLELLKQIKNH
jgi:hypothetical protein